MIVVAFIALAMGLITGEDPESQRNWFLFAIFLALAAIYIRLGERK